MNGVACVKVGVKPLSLEGREVGERVLVKYSPILIVTRHKTRNLALASTLKHLCSKTPTNTRVS
jgi:hypothetical protein